MSSDITGAQICNSPLNHSHAKMMYSFGRAERFPKNAILGSGCQSIYNLPPVANKRSASIGFGNKSDFTKENTGKCSSFYNYVSMFDQTKYRPYRYTFGIGREKLLKSYDKCVPGPGKYLTTKPFGSGSPKYTIRGGPSGRTLNQFKNDSPGPGAYKPHLYINPNGTFLSSNFRNVVSVDFGADHSQRFNTEGNPTPSPADYEKKSLIGKIFESRFKSTHGISMAMKYRSIDSRNNYPGPGAYGAFSEFGIYGNPLLPNIRRKRADGGDSNNQSINNARTISGYQEKEEKENEIKEEPENEKQEK